MVPSRCDEHEMKSWGRPPSSSTACRVLRRSWWRETLVEKKGTTRASAVLGPRRGPLRRTRRSPPSWSERECESGSDLGGIPDDHQPQTPLSVRSFPPVCESRLVRSSPCCRASPGVRTPRHSLMGLFSTLFAPSHSPSQQQQQQQQPLPPSSPSQPADTAVAVAPTPLPPLPADGGPPSSPPPATREPQRKAAASGGSGFRPPAASGPEEPPPYEGQQQRTSSKTATPRSGDYLVGGFVRETGESFVPGQPPARRSRTRATEAVARLSHGTPLPVRPLLTARCGSCGLRFRCSSGDLSGLVLGLRRRENRSLAA